MRTILAFLLAPAVTPLIYSIFAASFRPPGEGPTWIGSFVQHLFLAAVDSYLISYTVGLIVFLILRKLKRESVKIYACSGAIAGFLSIMITFFGQPITKNHLLGGGLFALFGLLVSTSFALIRGTDRKI